MNKNIIVNNDYQNGINYVKLNQKPIAKTISLSDEGCAFLNDRGADIILDFDKEGSLVGIEIIGLANFE